MGLKRRYLLAGALCALAFHAGAFLIVQGVLAHQPVLDVAADEGTDGVFVTLASADMSPAESPSDTDPEPVQATPKEEPQQKPDSLHAPMPAPSPETLPEPEPKPQPTPEPEPEPVEPVSTTSEPDRDVEEQEVPEISGAETAPTAEPNLAPAEDASATPATQADTGGVVNDEARYLQALLGHLNRYKRYPDSARRMRREGVVEVTFTVNRQGQVADARVVKSAGFRPLDDEVRDMLSRAVPLPGVPADYGRPELTVTLPVAFSLR
ncbi:TonB family protein [Marinobacter shengliensis]|uniref:TonB family protein n=1 Tax=Marinobacter shengliensis TaxID=1389223 RepID=UPI0035B7F02D